LLTISLVDRAIRGEFVTITRHGKPVAALVSVEAAELARKAMEPNRAGLVAYLRTFPGGEFERNPAPSRDRQSARPYDHHPQYQAFCAVRGRRGDAGSGHSVGLN
jgi:prevent-host-death family protein